MEHDSEHEQSRMHSNPESRFGWQPENQLQLPLSALEPESQDDAAPAQFAGPSMLGDTSPLTDAYWTPTPPGQLPPTIIQRQHPPAAQELLGRFGKPAMMALTVAAVSTAGLWQSSQPASAQPADTEDRDDSGNIRPLASQQQPALFELAGDADSESQTPYSASADRTEPFIYTVEQGDWVRHIAADFGLHTMTVVWNNHLPDPDFILPGQKLLILPVDGVMIEVQPGDTLNSLATAYGVSNTAIINYEPNGITNPDLIQPGDVLIIPGGVPQEHTPSEPTSGVSQPAAIGEAGTGEEPAGVPLSGDSVTIESGDTLAEVAQRFGVTIDELAQANNLGDVDTIFPGDELLLPQGAEREVDSLDTSQSMSETDQQASQPEPQPTPEPENDPEGFIELEPEPTPAPQPDPTPAPEPTATTQPAPEPTATTQPAPAPEPTATPQPDPTPTPQPEPTATPEPDPTPEPEQSSQPSDVAGLLEYYANMYGVDPNLVKAVAWRESAWNQNATSSLGAQGVMQIMPSTGTFINNNLVSQDLNIRGSAADNIHAGTAYLAHRIDQMGSVERGLAAYFVGPVSVQNNGVTGVARDYVNRIYEIRDYIATHGEPPSWR